ncbi:MAG TPA: acyl-CoA dehydrogenase family protein, partial [bacterium]|nr:acyl-CoA dehydrogenase family protein [bacterium]
MLDFTLSDEHQMVVDMVRDFAENVLGPGAEHRDRTKEYPTAERQQAAELGILGATVEEEWGGAGMDPISYLLINREISRRDAAFCTIMGGNVSLFCEGLRLFGTPEQKERWLRPAAAGEIIGGFATTEPHMGSDLAGMKATYRPIDSGFVLNGQKAYITNAK